ncbi:U-box domain-containing protein 8 [Syzygium oleosum]|uniref:U-box domain-containing protein 8 n=1 Tax=Syzygium oleosum TaxID=219896 RepID=UPI0011D1FD94|nr:U-box domain-containing protein 8 [Syzygium oleosum]
MTTQLPDDFRCPISLEIMSDPVILSSGHTFDRASIQRWLDSGHRTCPITKLPLPDRPSLIPNYALRSLISNFASGGGGGCGGGSRADPGPNPEPGALVAALTSRASPLESKLEALTLLTKLSNRDPGFRRRLTESGTVSVVLSCVDSDDGSLRERALSLLLNLSLDDDNKVGLVAEGAISKIVGALRADSANCRALAATIITSLAVVEVNKATIGEYPFAIGALISLLRDGNDREKKEAATALFAICSFPENRKRAAANGSVPVLIRAADSGLERAVEVLAMLAKCREGREVMGRCDGCVRVLVKMLRNGGCKGVQCALLTLYSLCCYSERICVEVRRQGVLEMCIRLLVNDNEKIRRNATNLAQLLQVDSDCSVR